MRLRKKHGGCSIGDVEWPEDGAVAEVPDELGAQLLALAPDEYEHVLDEEDEDELDEKESGGSIAPLKDDGDLIIAKLSDGAFLGEQSKPDLKQPNKAASAEDWKAYALAHGGFQEATGTSPHEASRKAIVDHYSGTTTEE